MAPLALALRLLAVLGALAFVTVRGGDPVLFDDEASYHYATVEMSTPVPGRMPPVFEHLRGNPYIGLTTAVYTTLGPNPLWLRLVNALLGTLGVVLGMRAARALGGWRSAAVAGLALACWVPLVFWSATILREMMVSVALLSVWWALVERVPLGWLRRLGIGVCAGVLLWGLRPYVLAGAALGVLATLAARHLSRRPRTALLVATLSLVAGLAAAGWAAASGQIGTWQQELAVRQATTRLETLGRLYVQRPEAPPFGRSALVVYRDSPTGTLLVGSIQAHLGDGVETVAFTDNSVRAVALSELTPVQQVRLPWSGVLSELGGNAVTVFTGRAVVGTSPVAGGVPWVLDALLWDLALIGVLGAVVQRRVPAELVAFPLMVTLVTVVALTTIPGAPGNQARHRDIQTMPLLLVVLGTALAASPRWRVSAPHTADAATAPEADVPSGPLAPAGGSPLGKD